jgi:D-sedoheptulose 7-phosphate isomerase
MSDAADHVREEIRQSIAVKESLLADEPVQALVCAAGAIAEALRGGRKVLLFGNGGSAADAQHLAAELVGRFRMERPALPAVALGTNTSSVTAIGNDYDFEQVFARQVEALGTSGDVAVAISTSGRSPNVIRGVEVARRRQLVTVALTGGDGGELAGLVDHCMLVPSDVTARIQESHILLGHLVCELVERALFASETA